MALDVNQSASSDSFDPYALNGDRHGKDQRDQQAQQAQQRLQSEAAPPPIAPVAPVSRTAAVATSHAASRDCAKPVAGKHHNICDWTPNKNDPQAKEWFEESAASRPLPLDESAQGTYLVKNGDCLSTIAERELHMAGKQGTGQEIAAEVARLIALNEDIHPTIGCNKHYVQAGWTLKITAPEQAPPGPAAVIETAKPFEAPQWVAAPAPVVEAALPAQVVESPPPPPAAVVAPIEAPRPVPAPTVVETLTIPIDAAPPHPSAPRLVFVPRELHPVKPLVDKSCTVGGACDHMQRSPVPMLYDTPQFKKTYGRLPEYQKKTPIENQQGWIIDQYGRRVPRRNHVQELAPSPNGSAEQLVIPGADPNARPQRGFSPPRADDRTVLEPRPTVAPTDTVPRIQRHFSPPPPDGAPLGKQVDTPTTEVAPKDDHQRRGFSPPPAADPVEAKPALETTPKVGLKPKDDTKPKDETKTEIPPIDDGQKVEKPHTVVVPASPAEVTPKVEKQTPPPAPAPIEVAPKVEKKSSVPSIGDTGTVDDKSSVPGLPDDSTDSPLTGIKSAPKPAAAVVKEGPPSKAAKPDVVPPKSVPPETQTPDTPASSEPARGGFVPVEQRPKEAPVAPARVETKPEAPPSADAPRYGRLPVKSPGDAPSTPQPVKPAPKETAPAGPAHGFVPVESR